MSEINYTLNLESTPEYTIDIGTTGTRGKGATVTVGTTTTLHSGLNASVDNSGTNADAVFNFSIPKGSVWFNGQGTPASILGDEGDYYIDLLVNYIYRKSSSTTWENIGAISGSSTWGSIVGTLSNQIDLQLILDSKVNSTTFSTHTTSVTSATSLGHIKIDGTTLTTSTTGVTQITTTGVTSGTYSNTTLTVDNYGRLTSVTNGITPSKTYYGTTTTTASTSTKVVTLSSTTTTTFNTGDTLCVYHSTTNTATTSVSLNTNGTIISIVNESNLEVSSTNPFYVPAGTTVEYVYNGVNWVYKNKIVTSYVNGDTWYRLWTDGWIEQGGFLSYGSTNDTWTTVTFPKAFSNTSYFVSQIHITNTVAPTYFWNQSVYNLTTSSFQILNESSNYFSGTKWCAFGY